MSSSNAYTPREAMDALVSLIEQAETEACVVVHRVAKARGYTDDQEYIATAAERPWHNIVGLLSQAKERAELARRDHELGRRGVPAPLEPGDVR